MQPWRRSGEDLAVSLGLNQALLDPLRVTLGRPSNPSNPANPEAAWWCLRMVVHYGGEMEASEIKQTW